MRTFVKHELPSLTRVDGEGNRTYLTPSGNRYPSVTSVVSAMNKDKILEWRKRVGEGEAAKVSGRASRRGTAIHSLCEDYLKTGEATPALFDMEVFNSMRPLLDRIGTIHCLETPLFSHHLQSAGTVDCIAEFDGKLAVIDFKTSMKPKPREWIHNYFIQTASYAVMFEELTGIPVPNVVIIMGVDDHEPLVFHEKRDIWIGKFVELREQYRLTNGF